MVKRTPFKIGTLREGCQLDKYPPDEENFVQARQANVYVRQKDKGIERLYVGVAEKHAELILELVSMFSPPYFLLYVLHTSRCDNELARYQSPPLEYSSIAEFFRVFQNFLAHDSRHDLWVHSLTDNVTIVWDRHDVFFIYGPLNMVEYFLDSHGFAKGTPLIALFPHIHKYHPEYDQAEKDVIGYFSWQKSPLQAIDLQIKEVLPEV